MTTPKVSAPALEFAMDLGRRLVEAYRMNGFIEVTKIIVPAIEARDAEHEAALAESRAETERVRGELEAKERNRLYILAQLEALNNASTADAARLMDERDASRTEVALLGERLRQLCGSFVLYAAEAAEIADDANRLGHGGTEALYRGKREAWVQAAEMVRALIAAPPAATPKEDER